MSKTATTILSVLVFALAAFGVQKIMHRATSASSEQVTPENMDKALQQAVDTLNKGGAHMVDPETRFDLAKLDPGHKVMYYYTLPNRRASQIDPQSFSAAAQTMLKGQVCAQQGMRKGMKLGVVYTYNYVTIDGVPAGKVVLDEAACSQ